MTNAKDPVYPQTTTVEVQSKIRHLTPFPEMTATGGITMREHYAGLAMAAIVSNQKSGIEPPQIPATALWLADKLIEELNK